MSMLENLKNIEQYGIRKFVANEKTKMDLFKMRISDLCSSKKLS